MFETETVEPFLVRKLKRGAMAPLTAPSPLSPQWLHPYYCSLLVTFSSLLVTFCSLQVTFFLLLVSCCSLLVTLCSSLVTFCSLIFTFSSVVCYDSIK